MIVYGAVVGYTRIGDPRRFFPDSPFGIGSVSAVKSDTRIDVIQRVIGIGVSGFVLNGSLKLLL